VRLLNSNLGSGVSERLDKLTVDDLELLIATLEKAAMTINPDDLSESDLIDLLDQIDTPKPPTAIEIVQGLEDEDLQQLIAVAPTTADKYLAQAELLSRSGALKEPTTTDNWPIDYSQVYAWRQYELMRYSQDPAYLAQRKAFYASGVEGCIAFINHWIDTHDPRNAGLVDQFGKRLPVRLPLVLFKRQEELIRFMFACMDAEADGLVEKTRDMGATWVALAGSIWMWIFLDAVTVGWGSATAVKLDRSGDSGSIFWKARTMARELPPPFKPRGLIPKVHLLDKRLSNPENGAGIVGEVGDEVGRGSRTRVYVVDEAAHFEHPESITAALSDTTRVRIDISSVSGLGTVFHRMRQAGKEWEAGQAVSRDRVNVFIMDWRHHPAKTKEWYDMRQAKFEAEGMAHIFAQEVDRDYAASLVGTIVPKKWLEACVDAHLKVGDRDDWFAGGDTAGLDVADEGLDLNAFVARKGWVINQADDWGDRDTGATTRHVVQLCRTRNNRMAVYYDSIGVGAGVKSEYNRLRAESGLPDGLSFVPWHAGGKVQWPGKNIIPNDKNSPKNKDYFANLKAQGWWDLRNRAYATYRYVTEGVVASVDQMISFDSKTIGAKLYKLIDEIAQPTAIPDTRMRLVVDKKPDGAKSPNLGDACMQCCFPIRPAGSQELVSVSKPVLVNAGASCLECGHQPVHELGLGRYQCHSCGHIGDRDEGTVDRRARGTPPQPVYADAGKATGRPQLHRKAGMSTKYAVGGRLLRR
jgi:phage terminase large subunit